LSVIYLNPLKSRIYEQIAKYLTVDDSVVHNNNANDMRVTQDLNSFGEIFCRNYYIITFQELHLENGESYMLNKIYVVRLPVVHVIKV
jgi:hypothetical protein